MLILYFFLISFLVNFVWEMWQMPFFVFNLQTSFTEMNYMCTQASLGDGLITVLAYLGIRYRFDNPRWYKSPTFGQFVLYISIGLVITIILEWINIYLLERWDYATLMPIIPLLNVGLVPLLQWIFVPMFILFIICWGENISSFNIMD